MKLIIDIPEKNYTAIKKCNYCYETLDKLGEYIKEGTPLLEGHGRLIDADKLSGHCGIHGMCECTGDCDNCRDYVVEVSDIKKAPTIIRSDKVEREYE